jgi:hypothetical protein
MAGLPVWNVGFICISFVWFFDIRISDLYFSPELWFEVLLDLQGLLWCLERNHP